jgi:hypothetical protein
MKRGLVVGARWAARGKDAGNVRIGRNTDVTEDKASRRSSAFRRHSGSFHWSLLAGYSPLRGWGLGLAARRAAQDPRRLGRVLPWVRVRAALLRRLGVRAAGGVPAVRHRNARPLSRLQCPLQLGVRGRVRSLRREAPCAGAVRHPHPAHVAWEGLTKYAAVPPGRAEAARCCVLRRVRILFNTNAPCVLASHRPSRPGSERNSAKPSYARISENRITVTVSSSLISRL